MSNLSYFHYHCFIFISLGRTIPSFFSEHSSSSSFIQLYFLFLFPCMLNILSLSFQDYAFTSRTETVYTGRLVFFLRLIFYGIFSFFSTFLCIFIPCPSLLPLIMAVYGPLFSLQGQCQYGGRCTFFCNLYFPFSVPFHPLSSLLSLTAVYSPLFLASRSVPAWRTVHNGRFQFFIHIFFILVRVKRAWTR